MKTITVKVFSACKAIRFFNVVNPFMFLDEDCPSQFRKHPERYFQDPVIGEPREVQVKIPDGCELVHDLGDVIRYPPSRRIWRCRTGDELMLCYPGASLTLEYAIIDGIKIPSDSSDCCNCPLDTNT